VVCRSRNLTDEVQAHYGYQATRILLPLISTFRGMCAVSNMAASCSSSMSCFSKHAMRVFSERS